jgi:predicted acyltransferase
MMTCGLASLLQAFLMYVIDIKEKKSWTKFFHVFGVNALALYVSSELLAILLSNIGVSEIVYNGIHTIIAPLKWASLAYAIYFVMLNFTIGYVLYRKRIYIKL